MTFTPQQVAALSAPLERKHVKERTQAGRTLSYVEGWLAISEANRIFGFDGWTRETTETRIVSEKPREIGSGKRPGWSVSYTAKVRVTVGAIVREGIGAGHGIDVDLGLAHESAIKEAETDAMKRALCTFGNPFGLALYDKAQTQVEDTSIVEAIMAAEKGLEAAAQEGIESLRAAFSRLDPDLRGPLQARAKALAASITTAKEAA